MLAVAADDGAGRRAGEPAQASLEGSRDLLVDHQMRLFRRVGLAARELREPQADDLARFDRKHRARIPGKAVIGAAQDRMAVERGGSVVVHRHILESYAAVTTG